MDVRTGLGFEIEAGDDRTATRQRIQRYINLKLLANGLPGIPSDDASGAADDAAHLLQTYQPGLLS